MRTRTGVVAILVACALGGGSSVEGQLSMQTVGVQRLLASYGIGDAVRGIATFAAVPGAADVERLRGEALAGVAQAKTNPDRVADRAFERIVYPVGHPLRPETFEETE